MSVNTYAKIKQIRVKQKPPRGWVYKFKLTTHNADTDDQLDDATFPTLKSALKKFREWNQEGWIEYGLQDIVIK